MKVGIAGTGQVGSTAAYTIAIQGISSEIVLVDKNLPLAEAQRMDILHAAPFAYSNRIASGGFDMLEGCDVIILAAGVSQRPGESRLQLLDRNAAAFREIIPQVLQYAEQPILLVATNPLDVMTQLAARLSGLPSERIIGTGTMLDTARFRAALAEEYGISVNSVHAYVLGEHGDSEVIVWSGAQIAGMPVAQFAEKCHAPISGAVRRRIETQVREAAYRIISGKGATYYGIGATLARLVRCIAHDERMVFCTSAVSTDVEGVQDVALSLPRVIGKSGVVREIYPALDEQEKRALRNSAQIIRNAVSGQTMQAS